MVKEHYRCSLGTKKVTKWGNSKGILLPTTVLENLNLSEGNEVEFIFEDGKIILRNKSDQLDIPNYDLDELLKEYEPSSEVL
jgi:antitoxin MazE